MYKIKLGDNNFLEYKEEKGQILIDNNPINWDLTRVSDKKFHIIKDNKTYNIEVINYDKDKKILSIKINSHLLDLTIQDQQDVLLEKLGLNKISISQLNELKAPMPGMIVEVKVSEGQEVKKGDPLVILEAMKMENIIKSSGDGKVKEVLVTKGISVEKNQVLIKF